MATYLTDKDIENLDIKKSLPILTDDDIAMSESKTKFPILTDNDISGIDSQTTQKTSQDLTIGNILKTIVKERVMKEPRQFLKEFPKAVETIDKPVEKIAQFIEPDDVPAEGNSALITHFPRFLAAEGVRSLKPSSLATAYVGGKLLKPVLSPVGKYIWSKAPEKLKSILLKRFTIGKGLPEEYLASKEAAELERLAGGREAEQVAKTLTTKPTQKAILAEQELAKEGLISE